MKNTKQWLRSCAALFLLLSAVPMLAADVTGTWTHEEKDGDGNTVKIIFTFKQDGAKLTGTVDAPGETVNISSGKVDGDKISFVVVFSDATLTNDGTIGADEIKLTTKAGPPDSTISETILKRSK